MAYKFGLQIGEEGRDGIKESFVYTHGELGLLHTLLHDLDDFLLVGPVTRIKMGRILILLLSSLFLLVS